MLLTFIVTWAPFVVVYFLPLLGIIEKGNVKTSDVLPVLTIKLGCTIMNPLVYVFQEPEARIQSYCYIFDDLDKINPLLFIIILFKFT